MSYPQSLIPELSVVMPAYNEEAVLPRSLAEATAALDRLCERWELVMVDDGSTDATPSILAEAAHRDSRIRVVTHPANLGYSAALAHGFAACRYETIFYTDSDAQFDFEDLRRAWPLLAEADMVAGWRRDRQDSRLRCFASHVFNFLQRTVLGVHARDVDCAFKLFRRSFFEQVRLSSEGFLIDAELYARASRKGLRVKQLPVTHRARPGGHSTVRPATVVTTLLHLWRLSGDLRRETHAGEAGRWQAHLPVFLLALVLGLTFQGSRGLWEPDEGRNVNIGLGMLHTSDWLIPRLSGEPYLDKPPFHYWTIAAGMALLGRNEWGARAGQALLFALTALLVGALGRRLWNDPDTGRLAALIYATSLAPFAAANVLTPDTPLAACTVLLAYAWWRAETAAARGPRFGWWLLTGAAAGLGALAKGPAILIFAAPLGLWMLLRGRLGAALREPGVWAGATVSLLIALSWYGPVVHGLPGAGAYMLDNQVTGRLFTETYQRNSGWWGAAESYLPILLFGLFPWCLWWLARGRPLLSSRLRSLPRFFRWSSPGQLLVLWIVCPLLVLLAASSRLPLYVLPLFAPAALATARGLALRRTAQGSSHGARRLVAASLAAWCLALLTLKGFAAQWEGGRDTRRYARWLETEAAGDSSSVVAVRVPLYGLPLYGFTDLQSVALEGKGYPMFTPQRTLAAAAPELAAGTPPPLIVVPEEKAQAARNLLANAGLSCQLRPSRHRLALLICAQTPGLKGP